jgi:hypothetical protein
LFLFIQPSSESNIDEDEKIMVEPIIASKTRQQTAKLKERTETMTQIHKPKTRSRTTSENVLVKSRTNVSTSPPITTPLPHQSPSTLRPRLHSPSHMPYPLRSPRTMTNVTKQQTHQNLSPVHFMTPPTSTNSGRFLHFRD